MRLCCLLLILAPFSLVGAEDTPTRVSAEGLPNLFRVTDKLLSGGLPAGDIGFRSLQKLGVKTVISVDGAKPDVERARKFGLRYIHLPIGYDGVPAEQGLRIAKAVRDLPGLVYLHCHHGKHRSPAAAAVVRLCLDDRCTVEAAVRFLRKAGTDPKYTGLYAAPKELVRPTSKDLDKVRAEFPEVAQVGGLMQAMVAIEERWDNLKEIRAAGWKAPQTHPDLDPAHEALMLMEHYREAARLPNMATRAAEFRRWLTAAATTAEELEALLRTTQGMVPGTQADKLFRQAQVSCTQCHAKYRDVPQKP
jgi:protein tyrosine phosphatase (PTP) superfamily phosphohydrolase (DUF442 family)